MTVPPAARPIVRSLSSILVGLLLVGSLRYQSGGSPLASSAAEILSLGPNSSLEQVIQGGETQSFELHLDSGTFLLLEIYQRGVSVSSRVLSPTGETAEGAGFEDPGSQLLALIAERAGTYRLDVIGHDSPKLSGRYKVLVRAMRPSAGGDEIRVEGVKALREARRLVAQNKENPSPQALARMEESLVLFERTGEGLGEVEALAAIAAFHGARNELQDAISWQQKVLDLARKLGLANAEAWALANLGSLTSQRGDQEQAISLLNRSLAIREQIGEPYEQAWVLRQLGQAYLRKKEIDTALQTFEQARSLAEAAGDIALQIHSLLGVGECYYRQYRLGQARELLEQALDLSRQADNAKTEDIEQNLAVLYQNQGQFQKALELFIRVAEKRSFKESGMMRYNMGNLYLELGDLDEAMENYLTSQAAFHAKGDAENEVHALIGIGRIHQRRGDARQALDEYLKARQLVPKELWVVLHSIGLARIDLGEPQEALSSLERALEIARTSHDKAREAVTLLALGSAYAKLHEAERAVESFTEATAVAGEIGYQSVIALALLQRSLLRRDQNRPEEALADVENALATVEAVRRNIVGDGLRTGFFATKRTFYDLDIDLLLQLDRLQPGKGYRARALEASERARARGLLDLLAEGRIDVRQGLDPGLRQREDDLAEKLSQVQRELRVGNANPERLEKLRAERDALDASRRQLEVEIQTKNRRYADVRYPIPIQLADIQRNLLDDRTALLEYALGQKGSTLFVITREALHTYALPAAGKITEQVQRLREALQQESFLKRRDYLESASQLYRDLIEPASAALAGKTTLLIVPDGVLYYTPFEALLTAAGDGPYWDLPYLLRLFSIAYIPSASVLASLREPRQEPTPSERKQLVAFAPFVNPGKETHSRGESQGTAPESRGAFKLLPASRREVAGIAGLYPEAALSFLGEAADETTVTHNPSVATARRLHFATHAQINEDHPEYSALVLAERPGEDGLLQMREIFNLKLSADLAVLSACETGLGKEVTGEGLIGLTRAFFYAGVPSLVVSLWNVVDGPTPDLMVDFYQNLDRLQDRAKALQTSKLSMVAGRTYSHPSYWAPFILLGEPR